MYDEMHDWTLISIVITWNIGYVEILFRDHNSCLRKICAYAFTDLHVPKLEPWGDSVSVNSIKTVNLSPNVEVIELEMQSGDVIQVTAKEIEFMET